MNDLVAEADPPIFRDDLHEVAFDLHRFGFLREIKSLADALYVGVDYHGCLVISVLRSAVLYRQVEGIWFAVRDSAGDSLGRQSRFV